MKNTELVDSLIKQIEDIPPLQEGERDAAQRRAEMIASNLFGNQSHYVEDIREISYWPGFYAEARQDKILAWNKGVKKLTNIAITMREQLEVFDFTAEVSEGQRSYSDDVFVVHGHDETMKEAVARTLNKLGLRPLILHEQPNKGRTIIEKISDYSGVGFSIVLLSPDDFGYKRNSTPDSAMLRARQNVVFELGFFLGKLGRSRVVALHLQEDNFEMPSDYDGVLFVPFDSPGRWQFDLAKELKAAGYIIDANQLIT